MQVLKSDIFSMTLVHIGAYEVLTWYVLRFLPAFETCQNVTPYYSTTSYTLVALWLVNTWDASGFFAKHINSSALHIHSSVQQYMKVNIWVMWTFTCEENYLYHMHSSLIPREKNQKFIMHMGKTGREATAKLHKSASEIYTHRVQNCLNLQIKKHKVQ